MNRELQKLMALIEALKLTASVRWCSPCLHGVDNFFDIEWFTENNIRTWQYKSHNSDEWISCPATSLYGVLEKNDVNVENLIAQLHQFVLLKASYCYDVVQETCLALSEESVYNFIEQQHNHLQEDVNQLLQNQDFSSRLKIIK